MAHPRILYLGQVPGDQVHRLIFEGIRRYAASRRWDAEAIPWRESRDTALPAILSSRRPAGCVVECSNGPPDLSPAALGRVPVVFTNCISAPRSCGIVRMSVDDRAIASAAFRELAAGKPEAYAIAGFRRPQPWSSARVRAFAALARRSRKPVLVLPERDPDTEGDAEYDARLAAWVASLPRRCGVFAANDATAAEIAAAARAAYRNVPRDLAIVGVDDDAGICESATPPLTSIPMDFENAGYQAAKMIGERIGTARHGCSTRPARRSRSSSFSIMPLLVVRRESTRGAGRREPRIREAVEMIRREACDGLTARDLVSRFPGSRWLFEMRFREAMGHSVLEEILHVRLERAITMLSRTDTPISAIADFCGFRSGIALRKLFRQRMEMSMLDWRRANGR